MTSWVAYAAGYRRDMLRAGSLAVLPALLLMVPSACSSTSDDEVTGKCRVYEYDIAADFKERKDYCASKADCDTFCASVAGLQNYPGCEYEETKYCVGSSLPAPKEQRVCALYQSIVCGGGDDDFQAHCDTSCTEKAGSDYEPSTGCLTQYRGPIVQGKTCDEALANLK